MRVALPDRPGSLGQVARTLGVSGADIVQVVVLERLGGRAIDDFTVMWPGGAGVERLRAGLGAMPGVRVDGIWRAIGAPVNGGSDAELVAQIASNPGNGLSTLVDAVPGLLAANWAAVLAVAPDWAVRRRDPARPPATPVGVSATGLVPAAVAGAGPSAEPGALPGGAITLGPREAAKEVVTGDGPTVVCASWQMPASPLWPEITPLRPRALTGLDGTRFAIVPFGSAGLVLAVARRADEDFPVAAFHATEVDRLAQLVRATKTLVVV